MAFETVKDTGKFRLKHAPLGTDELVVAFDNRGRFMRVSRFWLLYDYTTGVDAPEAGHKPGLDQLVSLYKFHQGRNGQGFKLHVIGVASTFKRDIRFDNDALARRRAANVVRQLRERGVAAEDIAAPQHVVRGTASDNDKTDRSVLISTGFAASSEFSIAFLRTDSSNVDEVLIRDDSWDLIAPYRVLPQTGKMDLPKALRSVREEPRLKILTGVGGAASDKQSKISLFSLDPTMMSFKTTGGILRVSGITFREKVTYEGFGSIPDEEEAPAQGVRVPVGAGGGRNLGPLIPDNPGPRPGPLVVAEEMTAFLQRDGRVL